MVGSPFVPAVRKTCVKSMASALWARNTCSRCWSRQQACSKEVLRQQCGGVVTRLPDNNQANTPGQFPLLGTATQNPAHRVRLAVPALGCRIDRNQALPSH